MHANEGEQNDNRNYLRGDFMNDPTDADGSAYAIQVFNPETGEFDTIRETHFTVRIVSRRVSEKVIFETDDEEYNG
jgi:hypothetical protein